MDSVLLHIPENPIPEGAVAGRIETDDGVGLRYAHWPASSGPRQGTVVVLHGRTEFIEKYFEVVGDLRRRGFAVLTFDWRGQGNSDRLVDRDRRKGHIEDFADYEADLEAIVKQVMLPDCPPPYFVLAHSTAANVVLRAAWRSASRFQRAVMTAPLLELNLRFLPQSFVKRLSGFFVSIGYSDRYIPGGGATAIDAKPFEGNPVTSDPKRFARTAAIADAAPNLTLGSPTIGWIHAACRSMDLLARPEFPDTVAVPTLMIVPGADSIVSPSAIEELSIAMKMGSHVIIPHARHEILMEADAYRNQFWAAFDAFIPGTRAY